jgi:hypothetical protein
VLYANDQWSGYGIIVVACRLQWAKETNGGIRGAYGACITATCGRGCCRCLAPDRLCLVPVDARLAPGADHDAAPDQLEHLHPLLCRRDEESRSPHRVHSKHTLRTR